MALLGISHYIVFKLSKTYELDVSIIITNAILLQNFYNNFRLHQRVKKKLIYENCRTITVYFCDRIIMLRSSVGLVKNNPDCVLPKRVKEASSLSGRRETSLY